MAALPSLTVRRAEPVTPPEVRFAIKAIVPESLTDTSVPIAPILSLAAVVAPVATGRLNLETPASAFASTSENTKGKPKYTTLLRNLLLHFGDRHRMII